MGILILNTDFVGKYKISQNSFSTEDLNSFISQYEIEYLYDLLGKELADLFIADLTAKIPITQRFLDIFNVIELDETCEPTRNEGMKKMILGFIHFEFMRKDPIKSTVSGQTVNVNELGNQCFDNVGIATRYNECIHGYNVIQYYIEQNSATYPEYKGKRKKTILPF